MSDGAVRARTIPVEADAFQMTEEALDIPEGWPAWVGLEVRLIDGHAFVSVEAPRGSTYVRVHTDDWIILTAGELSVCTPAEYERDYEAVGEKGAPCCGVCGNTDIRERAKRLLWCDDCDGLRPAGEMIATTTLSEREAT